MYSTKQQETDQTRNVDYILQIQDNTRRECKDTDEEQR